MAGAAYSQSEWEDDIWSFVFATAESAIAYGGKPPSSKIKGLLARGKTIVKNKIGLSLVANPFFVLNGVCEADDAASPETASYLRGRLGKTVAGLVQGVATGAAKSVTVVDPVSMAVAGVSLAATGVHIAQLSKLAGKWRNSATITGWLEVLLFYKGLKVGSKTISLASASIPYMPPGADTAVKLAGNALTGAGLGVTVGGMVAGSVLGVRRVAVEMHWRAYREQVIGRRGGAVGPASAILTELFTKRTQTRLLGAHKTDALIKEPAGWMAIEDKIALL